MAGIRIPGIYKCLLLRTTVLFCNNAAVCEDNLASTVTIIIESISLFVP